MKNHESRSVDSMSLLKVNQINYYQRERDLGPSRVLDRGCKKNYNHDGHFAPKNDQQYKKKGEKAEGCAKEKF